MILIQSFDENNWMIEQNFAGTIIAVKNQHRWFSCSIVAFHAQIVFLEKRKLKLL